MSTVRPLWNGVDVVVCLLVIAVVGWFGYKTVVELNYVWHWQAPLSYILNKDDDGWHGGLLLNGMAMSLRLMLVGGFIALLAGGAVATMALSPLLPLRLLARAYVDGLRHLPPIVFMFIFFYFVTSQIFASEAGRALLSGLDGAFWRVLLGEPALAENLISGALCLGIFEAAFVSEIIRAGVLSIKRGQWDAAKSVGLSRIKTLRLVILPQAVARVAAPLAGQLILLIKNSAILSVISVQELAFSAQETAVSTQQVFETWLLTAVFYFILCYSLSRLAKRWEVNLRAG